MKAALPEKFQLSSITEKGRINDGDNSTAETNRFSNSDSDWEDEVS